MPSDPDRAAVDAREPVLELVTGEFTACSWCLDGKGGECHTPGCLFWLIRAPDLAIRWKLEAHECTFQEVEHAPNGDPNAE